MKFVGDIGVNTPALESMGLVDEFGNSKISYIATGDGASVQFFGEGNFRAGSVGTSPIHDSETFPFGTHLAEYNYPTTLVSANDHVLSVMMKSSILKSTIESCDYFKSEEYDTWKMYNRKMKKDVPVYEPSGTDEKRNKAKFAMRSRKAEKLKAKKAV